MMSAREKPTPNDKENESPDNDLQRVIQVLLNANHNLKQKVKNLEMELCAQEVSTSISSRSCMQSVKQMYRNLKSSTKEECGCLQGISFKSEDGSDYFSKDGLECLKMPCKPDEAELTAGNVDSPMLETSRRSGCMQTEDSKYNAGRHFVSREEKCRMKYWRSCKYCSTVHKFGTRRCPAFGNVCKHCFGRNHFSSACWHKENNGRKCKSSDEGNSMSLDQEQYRLDFDRISAKPLILQRNPKKSSGNDNDFKQYQGHGSTDDLDKESLIQRLKSSERYDSENEIKNDERNQIKIMNVAKEEEVDKFKGKDYRDNFREYIKLTSSVEEIQVMNAFRRLSPEEKKNHYDQCKIERCAKCISSRL